MDYYHFKKEQLDSKLRFLIREACANLASTSQDITGENVINELSIMSNHEYHMKTKNLILEAIRMLLEFDLDDLDIKHD
ncbi:hypothetical protein N5E15_21720 [Pantoea stewartii]|uniref:hypothetical protein n=1 Tax=Pantoea stewartii TaxID=66269 RepID=UPI0021D4FC9C|nr:hypothetical protein [Pantoea stewartii]MCU7369200.1 hypothetical protein [Pantoea stewartii]